MSRRSLVVVDKTVGKANLGEWINPLVEYSAPIGQMIPFCKGRESIEAILRNIELLNPGQPVEYSGYSMEAILHRALIVRNEILYRDSTDPFAELSSHPGIVSYPPEVIWLANQNGINAFKKSLLDNLHKAPGLGLSKDDSNNIANKIASFAGANVGDYSFWEHLSEEYNGEKYGSILIDFQAYTASRLRCKGLAGLVPIVDQRHPTSIGLMNSFNEANAIELDSLRNDGIQTPDFYFYTVNMNSSMFRDSNFSSELENTVKTVNSALRINNELYDGLHLSIRGLDRISRDPGRVSVVNAFIERLREICFSLKVPFWFSRAGLPGLSFLDKGVNYCSCLLNMSLRDAYESGGGAVDLENYFGKVYHPVQQKRFTRIEVKRWTDRKGFMPEIRGSKFPISELEMANATRYRVNFGIPYNLANLCDLSEKWQSYITNGDEEPGQMYLSRCHEADFTAWGKW